ncbi:protein ANTI-SILENCING 1 isoform X2 [Salvia miltiorrhiza]|uniref:protein ANTI-SILENCING 1 isoform X2 n=1 Tax=Salvia miltiorrhiza TaxID=226208 RepID=UPI0025AB938B|nr:protein ANTI-SILENCING 1 isoform X2 [Salvia miltiorrhiza]XP_057799504.1 protein ANTI-SILENCING 1 isoform X2 [Salvia miltiorrhiza]
MLALTGPEELENPAFKWDKKRGLGGKNKNVQFYESFSYDGMDYALYDCVYMHKEGAPAPYIGKLVKIWETAEGLKKVKVHWFFRPSEISYYLKDAKVSENELFFASGDGKGLANLNPLEAIAGKCNVVCTSTDNRNQQPSAKELQMADYVFYRVFDVNSCTISDQIDDTVGGLEVNFVFNRRDGIGTLDGPKLDAGEKYEGNMVAFKETPGTVLEERNTTGDKNLGSNISEKKDKFKDIKLPVSQVHVEKGVKHAGKSCDLDNAPSKRVKFDGTVISKSNSVEGVKDSVGCRKDAKKAENSSPLDEKGVSLSKEAAISGHAEDGVGLQKNSESNENPNALQEKLSKPNAFSSSEKEKSRSTLRKDSFVAPKDKKVGGEKTSQTNVVSQDVTPRPSTTNVSPKETPKSVPNKDVDESEQVAKPAQSLSTSKKRPLEMTVVESKEDSNLGHDKSHEKKEKKIGSDSCPNDEGYLKKAKLDNSIKRSEGNKDNNIKKVKENTYVGPKNSPKVATCDNNGKSGLGEGLSKDPNEKEKNHAREMKKSPKSLACDDKSKSKLREGSPKEFDNEKDGKKNLPKSLTCFDKTKSKLREGPSKEYDYGNDGKKNSPKSLTCDNRKNSPKSFCDYKAKAKLREGSSKEHDNEKDGKLSNNNLPNRIATKSKDGDGRKVGGKIIEVTRRPPEKATWIKLSWEQQMKTALDQGRLVLLLNLDPEYTSGEVEDIIWHTFSESCTARVLPHTAISDPYSGHAFVVFKSRGAANKVVDKLDEGCLMLPNQRPLVACYGDLPKLFGKQTAYVGHLQIDKVRRQMLRGTKEAVSTSHYSQNNTIEFEMAMDWCLLQSKSDKWWKTLYELHRKELKKHSDNFKSK